MDKNIIFDRISRMREWDSSEPVNEILLNTFTSLNAYIEGRFEELTAKIEDEAAPPVVSPEIVTAVFREEDGEKQPFLFPVSSEPPLNCPGYITTVFAECDYPAIKSLIGQTYTAEIKTETQTLQVQVALRYSQKYLQRVQSLYYAFNENELPWSTVNGVYFYKFLDVYCAREIAGNIIGFDNIDFGRHQKYISYDKTLLWNVKSICEPVKPVAKPAGNAIQYEHALQNLQLDEHRYLICPPETGERFTCFRRGQALYVRTYSNGLEKIDLLRINTVEETDGLYLQPKSNRKKNSLVENLAKNQHKHILTRGEAERIVYSLKGETGLNLVDVKVLSNSGENAAWHQCVDFNSFIEGSALLKDKKPLLFSFRSSTDKLWAYEEMFYVLSELQLYFHEYHCVGELL